MSEAHTDIFWQLLVGSVVIALTVAIHAEMLDLFTHAFKRLKGFARSHMGRFGNTSLTVVGMLYILMIHTIEVWIWAGVLMATGAVQGLEPAVYFALTAFTTVGFGDITLSPEWRLLSALIGANGFLLFGWSTAYMVELIRRTA